MQPLRFGNRIFLVEFEIDLQGKIIGTQAVTGEWPVCHCLTNSLSCLPI